MSSGYERGNHPDFSRMPDAGPLVHWAELKDPNAEPGELKAEGRISWDPLRFPNDLFLDVQAIHRLLFQFDLPILLHLTRFQQSQKRGDSPQISGMGNGEATASRVMTAQKTKPRRQTGSTGDLKYVVAFDFEEIREQTASAENPKEAMGKEVDRQLKLAIMHISYDFFTNHEVGFEIKSATAGGFFLLALLNSIENSVDILEDNKEAHILLALILFIAVYSMIIGIVDLARKDHFRQKNFTQLLVRDGYLKSEKESDLSLLQWKHKIKNTHQVSELEDELFLQTLRAIAQWEWVKKVADFISKKTKEPEKDWRELLSAIIFFFIKTPQFAAHAIPVLGSGTGRMIDAGKLYFLKDQLISHESGEEENFVDYEDFED
jgi:hypothetical protein